MIAIDITVIYFISKVSNIPGPNTSNITAKFHTITMPVTVNLEAIFHMKY